MSIKIRFLTIPSGMMKLESTSSGISGVLNDELEVPSLNVSKNAAVLRGA